MRSTAGIAVKMSGHAGLLARKAWNEAPDASRFQAPPMRPPRRLAELLSSRPGAGVRRGVVAQSAQPGVFKKAQRIHALREDIPASRTTTLHVRATEVRNNERAPAPATLAASRLSRRRS